MTSAFSSSNCFTNQRPMYVTTPASEPTATVNAPIKLKSVVTAKTFQLRACGFGKLIPSGA